MVNKKYLMIVFLITAISIFSLHAQDPNFFIERRFVQRLSWSGDEYALRYNIIVEREEGGRFRQVYQEYSTAFHVDVSLSPGRYRYRVIPYDFLGRQGEGTEWIDFEILTALYPQLFNFESDDSDEYVLTIHGMNISAQAEIFMRMNDGTIMFPSYVQIAADGNSARLVFDEDLILPDNFNIYVRNPGGLETTMRVITRISFLPGVISSDFFLTDEYLSMLESAGFFLREHDIHGIEFDRTDFDETGDEEFETEESVNIPEREPRRPREPREPRYRAFRLHLAAAFTPLLSTYDFLVLQPESASAFPFALKVGFINIAENKYSGWGMEAAMSWFNFDAVSPANQQGPDYRIQAMTFDVNLMMQIRSQNEKTALRFRLGAGFTSLNGSADIQDSLNSRLFNINIGAAFLWLPGRSFYMEAGTDFVSWFFNEENAGAARSFIGAGFRL